MDCRKVLYYPRMAIKIISRQSFPHILNLNNEYLTQFFVNLFWR